MKRKLFSAILFGALITASTSGLTSCKDYDDDINNLRSEITTNATTLKGLVDEKVNNLNAELTTLKSQQSSLQEALNSSSSKLEAAIEAAKKDASAYADVQAAAAEKAAIEAAKANTDAAVAVLEAAIKEANEKIAAQGDQINNLLDADKKLTEAIALAKEEVAAAAAQAQEAADKAQATADANAETLKTIVASFAEAKQGLDDQISILDETLQSTIAAVAANKAEADGQIAQLTSLIESNTATIKQLEEAYKEADAALAQGIAQNLAKITANTESIAKNAEEIAALKASLDAQVQAVMAYVDAQVAALKAELGADIDVVKADLAAAVAEVKAHHDAIAANQEAIEANSEAIKAIVEDVEDLTDAIVVIAANIDEIAEQVDANTEQIDANTLAIANLQTALEEANGKIKANAASIEAVKESLNKAIENSAAAREQLKGELEDAIADAIAEQSSAFTTKLNVAVDGLVAQINKLGDRITAIENDLNGDKGIKKQIENILVQLGALSGDEGTIATINESISTVQGNLNTAKTDLNNAINGVQANLDSEITQVYLEIQSNALIVRQYINTIYDELSYETKRLKSLVFVPETYKNGIECIKFATLKYKAWNTAATDWWKKSNAGQTYDPTETPKQYVIDDADKTVEYLVNPLNVITSDIVGLSYISNKASNTRAANPVAPINVVDYQIGYNKNGAYVMTVKLAKNKDVLGDAETFGNSDNNFYIVSLKADLSDKFLTDEEKEQGVKNPSIFSDWARLVETTSTPRIHNALSVNDDGSVNEYTAASHFWSYGVVYNGGDETDELDSQNNYIAKEFYYMDDVRLNDLVDVCDRRGTRYDIEKYGLRFEFKLMDYKLKNENTTSDATNQKHFAKFKDADNTVLVSTSRDGQLQNRDAIGRQPLVQVVLKDYSDEANPKVVDVRYFKIKWVDKNENLDYGKLGDLAAQTYECGKKMKWNVLEEDVNKLFAAMNMSKPEFQNTYSLNTSLYNSIEDAKNGTSNSDLGSIGWRSDNSNPGQTRNIQWSFNTANTGVKATQDDYAAGYKSITAYGYFYRNDNTNAKILFKLTAKMNITKMGYKDGVVKDQTMWKNGLRYVNPQLDSDPVYGTPHYGTTTMLGNFLKGYMNNGASPANVSDLVKFYKYTSDVKFVFDKDALAEMSSKWIVSTDGTTLSYEFAANDVEEAATIDNSNGLIELSESNNGAVGSEPTRAALLLVGKTVPVKLEETWCSLYDVIDNYGVNFITPLEFTNNAPEVTLYDITANGSNSALLAGKLQVREVFTTNKRIVWDNTAGSDNKTNADLVEWYGVKNPKFDIANAKVNISKTTGQITSNFDTKLSDLKNPDGSQKYSITVEGINNNGSDTPAQMANAKIKFSNNSGQAIGQEFKVQVPVSVDTKWQKAMPAVITVTIKPNI